MSSVSCYADTIKASVTMLDVAEYYGFPVDRRTRKILCPFHSDTHPSLHIYSGDRGYHCFVCGVGGDVIDFVMRLFGLSFIDACKKLNEDFRLNMKIGEDQSEAERMAAEKAFRERMERQKAEALERERLVELYNAACNRYAYLDNLRMQYKPVSPSKPVSQEYIYACQNIDAVWQDVLDAQDALERFDKKRHN